MSAAIFVAWGIYRTEVINDQVITMPSTWRAGYFGSRCTAGELEIRVRL
jgi:hypothetical protein